MAVSLTIGEVASATGLQPSALRYYEEVGLITPAGRAGGRRIYHPQVLDRLAMIALAQETGFTIAEIRTLLAGGHGTHELRRLGERKLKELDRLLGRTEAMRNLLARVLTCDCGGSAACGLFQEAAARRHQD